MGTSATEPATNVRPLRHRRVLVVSLDRRFLNFADFVLGRNGFAVVRCERFSDAPELVDRYGPDVVVIDASDSVATATRLLAAVHGASPHRRVIVVCEDDQRCEAAHLQFVGKWNPEALLAELVAHASPDGEEGGLR